MKNKKVYAKMNCITLASELRSDDNGVPVEWTLLKAGETAYTKEGIDGKLSFTEKDLAEITWYKITESKIKLLYKNFQI